MIEGSVEVDSGRRHDVLEPGEQATTSPNLGRTAIEDEISWSRNKLEHLALLAGLVGICLAVCGTAMQGLFRNPLADPSLIGVSSGASAGASMAIVFGAGAVLEGTPLAGLSLRSFADSLRSLYPLNALWRPVGNLPFPYGPRAHWANLLARIASLAFE